MMGLGWVYSVCPRWILSLLRAKAHSCLWCQSFISHNIIFVNVSCLQNRKWLNKSPKSVKLMLWSSFIKVGGSHMHDRIVRSLFSHSMRWLILCGFYMLWEDVSWDILSLHGSILWDILPKIWLSCLIRFFFFPTTSVTYINYLQYKNLILCLSLVL